MIELQPLAEQVRLEQERRKAEEQVRLEEEPSQAAEQAWLAQERRRQELEERQKAEAARKKQEPEGPQRSIPSGSLLRIAPVMVVVFGVAWMSEVAAATASSFLRSPWDVCVYVLAGAVLGYLAGVPLRTFPSFPARD